MDKQFFQELLEFYQNQLLLGYYKKRGKSLVVPHILYSIDRLLVDNPDKRIHIMDVGCGKGDLLYLLSQAMKSQGMAEKVKLHGIDHNQDLIDFARGKNGDGVELSVRDVRHDVLDDMTGKYDLVVVVNMLHEVFSSLIGKNKRYPEQKVRKVKSKIADTITQLEAMLSERGTLIMYDGLDVEESVASKKVRFTIKDVVLKRYLGKFIDEYRPWQLSVQQKKDGTYEMNMRDFLRFITTFKYLNTKLWPVESQESYAYMSVSELKDAIKNAGLAIDSELYLSNDVGLWSSKVEILSKNVGFPIKSYLFTAQRKYLPSQFDFFET